MKNNISASIGILFLYLSSIFCPCYTFLFFEDKETYFKDIDKLPDTSLPSSENFMSRLEEIEKMYEELFNEESKEEIQEIQIEEKCPYLLGEDQFYDMNYKKTGVMKVVKGYSCFAGHYTPTPKDKDYEGILSGLYKEKLDDEKEKIKAELLEKKKELKEKREKIEKTAERRSLCLAIGGSIAYGLIFAGQSTLNPVLIIAGAVVGIGVAICSIIMTSINVSEEEQLNKIRKEEQEINTKLLPYLTEEDLKTMKKGYVSLDMKYRIKGYADTVYILMVGEATGISHYYSFSFNPHQHLPLVSRWLSLENTLGRNLVRPFSTIYNFGWSLSCHSVVATVDGITLSIYFGNRLLQNYNGSQFCNGEIEKINQELQKREITNE